MSEQIATLAQKLLKIQTTIGSVTKSSDNPHFRSKFADLNEVLSVAKPVLNDAGIFIAQNPGADTFGKYLETSLIDSISGQQINGRVYFSGNEDNMQKIGAAITYARRFGLVSLLALESVDDDGETAVGRSAYQNQDATAAAKPRTVKATTVAGVRSESKAAVPQAVTGEGSQRKAIMEKISLTSKVIVDSKRATQEQVMALLTSFGAESKDDLTGEQAVQLLTKLQEILNERK